ncbi:hypothetical protein ACSFBF_14165 [Variovorax sp. ZT5P49]|uniref:hypothetical protein n=1 Tax=Variovorax sp. ZT5P49 TaxID=3443733 RepID=UPI003F48293F
MRSFLYRNVLDLALWLLGVVSLLLMLKSSTDPRPEFVKGTSFEQLFKPFSTGNQVVFDIAVGIVVSLFVYVLVVRLPAWQKKRRVKAHLLRRYDDLKRQCITHFLWACREPAASDLIDELMELEKFKEFFKTKVSRDQDRWHAVLNGLNEQYVASLVRELDMFRNELDYALTAIEVSDAKVFSFMRNFTQVLQRSRYWSDHEDQLKPLSQFMWSAFAGWSFVTGYTGKDAIAEMIDAI